MQNGPHRNPRARRTYSRRVSPTLLALACGLLIGCAGEGGDPSPTPTPGGDAVSFATLQSTIFDQRCNSATCHAAGTRAGNLSLDADQSYDELVNVAAANAAAAADGLVRVAPEDPDASFLLRKLTGDLAAGEGSRMPLGSGALGDSEIALVAQWITEGAPRN